ncbi:MAG: glycoside hydrolase family 20 protein [Bacteroidaceae bacterium]|nr:glycoside hydrolase family 20 protein [Bacteroidaceae bacterium]
MIRTIFTVIVCLLAMPVFAQRILPQPVKVNVAEGAAPFQLSAQTVLKVDDKGEFYNEMFMLQGYMHQMLGHALPQLGGGKALNVVKVSGWDLPANAYRLKVTADTMTLEAQTAEGAWYGVQTLRQLMEESTAIPQMEITDYPQFEWRGLMHDVSRHFFTLEYLKHQIDLLSRYKMNKLHLHLTDDQGWRMEIKKYPELTQKSAWRTWNNQDSTCMEKQKENPYLYIDPRFVSERDGQTVYGGYYTQQQLRDLVAYAAQRHVDIVPEVDSPGHMMAAISSHPEFTATGSAAWGSTFSVPLSPANENVFTFIQDVFDEVMDVFPSHYIHIGADEVEKTTWKESQACQDLMKREGIATPEELQNWFVMRVKNHVTAKGREVIAWDDALEGGKISTDTNIMYWRSWLGTVPNEARDKGHKLIFTTGDPFYFDQVDSTLYKIYHFQDLQQVSAQHRALTMGAQANVWCETIPNEDWAHHLIWPRLLGVAELTWTPTSQRNWEDFKARVAVQREWLKKDGVYVAQPSPELIPTVSTNRQEKFVQVSFETELVNPEIRYTLDGKEPTLQSKLYTGPIRATKPVDVCAAVFLDGKMQQPVFRRPAYYHSGVGAKVTYNKKWNSSYPAGGEEALTNGIQGRNEGYGDGNWQGFTSDLDVVVDLQQVRKVKSVGMRFMQAIGPGVYMPGQVEVSVSADGQNFAPAFTVKNEVSPEEKGTILRNFKGNVKNGAKVRYIHIKATNDRHQFIFTDEIIIE